MKILLLNPGFKRKLGKSERISTILPPLGLAYIAAFLREKKKNADVKILDINALNLEVKDVINYAERYKPNLVGLSATTPTICKVFDIAKSINEKYPEIKIIVGGPHPSALPLESIKKSFIDFVAIGESELTMLELVEELEKDRKKNFKKIDGLVFKEKGRIIKNKERARIKELDSLPFPAFDLLPLDKYTSANSQYKKFINILTSRGCPGRCVYCNKLIFGDICYTRSAENIIKEIEFLIKKYKYKEFHIVDDLFTIDRKRVIDFCNLLLKKNIKIKWKCGNGVRVGTVDLELLKLMKKAGCYSLSYGIESGNQQILNNIRKGQTLKQCANAVKWTKEAGIECIGFFMLGNLGENEKTMQETINFAKNLDLDIAQFSILVPYPGTFVRGVIEKEGKIFENNWERYDNLEGKAIFEHEELKKETMEKMFKKAYKEYYMRPKFIIRKIFKLRTLNELKNEINGFLALLEY